jgi:hypothetical protein
LRTEASQLAGAFRAENSCRRNLELMLELAAEAHDMRLSYVPVTDFASAVGVPSYLRRGWSVIEAGLGVWTVGDTAELEFSVRPNSDALIFRAKLRPFIGPQSPELRVRVCVNHTEVAEWHFRLSTPTDQDWCWREATIAPGIVAVGYTRLTLHIDRPASPRELGLSDDTRLLGVMLREVSLTATSQ